MSLPAILWAMYEAPVKTNPTEKCVLMVLAEHADTSGANAFPSWERIAKIVGVSTRTIGSTLSSLHAKGVIRRGDQRIAEAAVRGRGKSRAYAPTVWDLVMDGSHAAATQAHLPPVVAEDREAIMSRRGQRANVQVNRPAGSAGPKSQGSTSVDSADVPAGEETCKSCMSASACFETCDLASPRHEVCRRSGVKPASDKPSTSTKNWNPPPPATASASGRSSISSAAPDLSDLNLVKTGIAEGVDPDVEGLVAAVRASLPAGLARQAIGRALERRCLALATAGWSADQVAAAVRDRCWDGAGVGAVVAWLEDLRNERPAATFARRSSSTAGARGPGLVDEYWRDLTSAAASDSPARGEAVRFAAVAAANSRGRRLSTHANARNFPD